MNDFHYLWEGAGKFLTLACKGGKIYRFIGNLIEKCRFKEVFHNLVGVDRIITVGCKLSKSQKIKTNKSLCTSQKAKHKGNMTKHKPKHQKARINRNALHSPFEKSKTFQPG